MRSSLKIAGYARQATTAVQLAERAVRLAHAGFHRLSLESLRMTPEQVDALLSTRRQTRSCTATERI